MILINSGPSDGLLLADGTKPLSEPLLDYQTDPDEHIFYGKLKLQKYFWKLYLF